MILVAKSLYERTRTQLGIFSTSGRHKIEISHTEMGRESNFTFTASAPPPSRHGAALRDHVPSLVPEEECEPVSSVPGLSVGSLKGGFLPRLTLSYERIGIVRMPGAAEG